MISKMIALDWRAMKVYQIRVLLLPVFIFLFGLYSPIAIIPISVFMAFSFSINPFAVEEKGELNILYLTLPVTKKSIVTGRYMLSIIMAICGITAGSLMLPLANYFSSSKWFIGSENYLVLISLSYLLYAIINIFTYPVLFKLGYAKGKFWGFYLPIIFFAILYGGLTAFISENDNSKFAFNLIMRASANLLALSGCLVAAATIILILSYMLSLKIYSKREF